MVRINVQNRLINHDPVRAARLYLNPTVPVYPPPAGPPAADAVTDRSGNADLNISGLAGGTHFLWIVPENATDAVVGPPTARGIPGGPPDRIYRGLQLLLTVRVEGNQRTVTNANVQHATQNNGTSTLQGGTVQIRLQPVWMKSPKSSNRGVSIDMIVVHRTGGDAISSAIWTFLNGNLKPDGKYEEPGSCHYLINKDGQVLKMVMDEATANQAGPSRWGSATSLNSRSIGIENVNGDGEFREAQYLSLIRLIRDLSREHGVPSHRIIGHGDVSTDDAQLVLSNRRIACPGARFEWPRLEREGFGLLRGAGAGAGGAGGSTIGGAVAEIAEAVIGGVLTAAGIGTDPFGGFFDRFPTGAFQTGDNDSRRRFGGRVRTAAEVSGTPVANLQRFLHEIGYSVGTPDGDYGNRTARAVLHFQTHFSAGGNGPIPNETVNRQTAALMRAVWGANPHSP